MTKQKFLENLKAALLEINDHDVDERISFYSEMIDDLIDEGTPEDKAVAKVGPIKKIIDETIQTIPIFELVKRKVKKSPHIPAWGIALIAIGLPIWIALAASAFAIFISLLATMWSVVISLWAVLLSFGVGAIAGLLGGIALIFTDAPLVGLMAVGAGFALSGLSIFMFYACKFVTKGAAVLSKMAFLAIKKAFI